MTLMWLLLLSGTLLVAPGRAERPSPCDLTVAMVDSVAGYVIQGLAVDKFARDLDMLIPLYAEFMSNPYPNLGLNAFLAPRPRPWSWLRWLRTCAGSPTPSASAAAVPIAFLRELLQSPDTTGVKLAAVLMAVMSPDLLAKDAASLLSLLFLGTGSAASDYAALYDRILARLPDAAFRQDAFADVLQRFTIHTWRPSLAHPSRMMALRGVQRRLMAKMGPTASLRLLRSETFALNSLDWAVLYYDDLVHVFQDRELLRAAAAHGLPDPFLAEFLALFVWRLYDFDPDHVLTMIATQKVTMPHPSYRSRWHIWKRVQTIVDVVQHGLCHRRRPLLTIKTLVHLPGTQVASALLRASIAHLPMPCVDVLKCSFAPFCEVVYDLLGRHDARRLIDDLSPYQKGKVFVRLASWDNLVHRVTSAQMGDDHLETSTALVLRLLRSLGDDHGHRERHQILFSLLLQSWSEPLWNCRKVLLALVEHDLFDATTSWVVLFAGLRVVLASRKRSMGYPSDQMVKVFQHDRDMLSLFLTVLYERQSGDDPQSMEQAASLINEELADQGMYSHQGPSGGVSEDNTCRNSSEEPAEVELDDQDGSEYSFSFRSPMPSSSNPDEHDCGSPVGFPWSTTLAPVDPFGDGLMDAAHTSEEAHHTHMKCTPGWASLQASCAASSCGQDTVRLPTLRLVP